MYCSCILTYWQMSCAEESACENIREINPNGAFLLALKLLHEQYYYSSKWRVQRPHYVTALFAITIALFCVFSKIAVRFSVRKFCAFVQPLSKPCVFTISHSRRPFLERAWHTSGSVINVNKPDLMWIIDVVTMVSPPWNIWIHFNSSNVRTVGKITWC